MDIMKASSKYYPKVMALAEAMIDKLDKNDHKGGWEDSGPGYLETRLKEEANELEQAVTGYIHVRNKLREARAEEKPNAMYIDDLEIILENARKQVLSEAADVSNFALMLADRFGGLDEKS